MPKFEEPPENLPIIEGDGVGKKADGKKISSEREEFREFAASQGSEKAINPKRLRGAQMAMEVAADFPILDEKKVLMRGSKPEEAASIIKRAAGLRGNPVKKMSKKEEAEGIMMKALRRAGGSKEMPLDEEGDKDE